MVNDERVPNNERKMPMLAAGYSQSIIVDNTSYYTTAHSAVTPTVLQAFKMMNPKFKTKLNIPRDEGSCVPEDLFSKAVGSGYATMASYLGFNGNGGFKAAMKLEQRDLLVAAAYDTEIHQYAEAYIDLYEAESPSNDDQKVAKENRRGFQQNLSDLWTDKLYAFHYSIAGGINGMEMFYTKFKYMTGDPKKEFRFALNEAMSSDPRNQRHPVVMYADNSSQKHIDQLTRVSHKNI